MYLISVYNFHFRLNVQSSSTYRCWRRQYGLFYDILDFVEKQNDSLLLEGYIIHCIQGRIR